MPVSESVGNNCTIWSNGCRLVGDFPFGQVPVGETLNLKAMLAVCFFVKVWPLAGDEKPPPQISNALFDVC